MSKLIPIGNKTFCNVAIRELSEEFGYKLFNREMSANDMIDLLCSINSKHTSTSWARGVTWAQSGGIAILAKKYPIHGHIASISPEPMELSPSLGIKVPVVANVGKTNGRILASAAFPCMNNGQPIQGWEPECFVLNYNL